MRHSRGASAIAVATAATLIEFHSDDRICSSPSASSNHFVVKPWGGHAWATLSLNA